MTQDLHIEVPGGATKVLLHACCAPCSSAIVECLMNNEIRPVIFYSNSNIYPFEEYEHRLNECLRYAKKWGLEIVDDVYDHEAWGGCAVGLENEPERGSRCLQCFKFRLLRAAQYASAHGFEVLTTTLASSRWKNLDQVNEAGRWACAQVPGVVWWDQNWRKGGLQERRNQIIKEEDFYNQLYCGCEYSQRG
jgi:predicted adenine nucleotide alpha hydrolase (AANH) superfamily ATPase